MQRQVSALLLISGTKDHQYLARELAFGVPVVFVGRPATDMEADCVLVDDRAGVKAATEALLEAGHRRIGVIYGLSNSYPSQERLAGYFEAHLHAGVKLVPEFGIGDCLTTEAATQATAAMLSVADPPTALLGLNHGVSVGVLNTILRTGANTVFVGLDDFELAEALGISVIDRCPEELGRAAALAAIKRITDPDAAVERVSLAPKLVVRGRL